MDGVMFVDCIFDRYDIYALNTCLASRDREVCYWRVIVNCELRW